MVLGMGSLPVLVSRTRTHILSDTRKSLFWSDGDVTTPQSAALFGIPSQAHYDWGLRSVKSVLYVAGAFKRASLDMLETALLMRALRDFNKPKIIAQVGLVVSPILWCTHML